MKYRHAGPLLVAWLLKKQLIETVCIIIFWLILILTTTFLL